MIHVVNDPIHRILDMSQHLRELRQRLDDLNAERVTIERQIAECVEQLAATAGGHVTPPPNSLLSTKILWALRRHPDRPLAPADVAQMIEMTGRRDLTNVRVLLSRMSRDGRVRKVAHGRYMTLDRP